ncbi:MAG: SMC-Scp complex subunit ScpB, partial [Dehalococcoidia bacterium]
SVTRVEGALDALAESLREAQRGIRLQRGPQGAQLVSAPEASAHVERFLGLEANRRLSTAALETLAIVAYRQPITRGQVDAVRGVSSDGAIATLRSRDLIEAAGHAPGPGRPMLFRTTQRFLEHFGLERPGQLPALPDDIDLPPAEIGAQLGLDEAAVVEALAAPPVEVTPEPEDIAAEPPEASEETEDDIAEAIAAVHGPDVEIPSDVRALTVAAEHAFEASRDRLADEPS